MDCGAFSTHLVDKTEPKSTSVQWLNIAAFGVTLMFSLSLQVKLLQVHILTNSFMGLNWVL